MSAVEQPYHTEFVQDLKDHGSLQTIWTLRNDDALKYWKLYTETAMQENINPIWTNRVGHVNWVEAIKWAELDIEMAKQ